ncbi:MAG TPA: signal peptide peptidase SppA [Tepidisphaeraceae bacterium]|nr:signal peptide peptidase SppA [Tepidisphaeraceae bacterium]
MRLISLLIVCLFLTGCSWPSLLITPIQYPDKIEEVTVASGSSSKIAIIPLDGMIANARVGGGVMGQSENKVALFEQQLAQAESDPNVKAVVLRINSPGGTVTGSDAVYELVKRFKERSKKPVIASCQELTASGGYYVALASDRIVAQPTSVVGSIGVIFQTFNVTGTMNMIGLKSETIKSGEMKDMGSPFKEMTAHDRQVMQALIDEYFARFKGLVGEHRHLSGNKLDSVSDGRIFSGEQAFKLGLIDQLGTLEDAIDVAREMGGAKGAKAIMYRRPYGPAGSIYASSDAPVPEAAGGVNINLPESALPLPTGFWYAWRP